MKTFMYLAMGGAAGTLARFAVSSALQKSFGPAFPFGTLAVNALGCLILGYVWAFAEARPGSRAMLAALVMTGFCGAFTTFSTMIQELAVLLRQGHSLKAFVYFSASTAAGFWLFVSGLRLGSR